MHLRTTCEACAMPDGWEVEPFSLLCDLITLSVDQGNLILWPEGLSFTFTLHTYWSLYSSGCFFPPAKAISKSGVITPLINGNCAFCFRKISYISYMKSFILSLLLNRLSFTCVCLCCLCVNDVSKVSCGVRQRSYSCRGVFHCTYSVGSSWSFVFFSYNNSVF